MMSVRVAERERNGLMLALDALSTTDSPAIFVVWQEDADPTVVLEICRSVEIAARVIAPPDLDWLEIGVEDRGSDELPAVWILPRGLSGRTSADRKKLNDAREQLLALGKKLIFIEPFQTESSLREDYLDLFAVARHNFHLEVIGDDYLFDNGDANRLETLQESYPPSFTRGSTLFIHGKPSFKAPPQIPCPKGHGLLKRGQTTISFQHAPAETRDQAVSGWVCPVCGEAYVPGAIAREAHRRAFQKSGASGSVV
jgi:hypothetical protein